LALPVKDECLRYRVAIGHQKADEIVVGFGECVLNAKLFCERGNFLLVTWPTDI